MKFDSTPDSRASQFARIARDYVPKPSRKFRDLLPLKAAIAELRQRHASYKTITHILANLDIAVSCNTVFRFCHEILGEPKGRYRRERKRSMPTGKKLLTKDSVTQHGPNSGGPRIADPNTI